MERLEELTHRPSRQLGVWLIAAMTALGVFAAIGNSLGSDADQADKDPLDSFGKAAQLAGLAPRVEPSAAPTPEVDRKSLVFPEVLAAAVVAPIATAESRPEVEAAIAAAAAELKHPDPLFEPSDVPAPADLSAPAAAMITTSPQVEKLSRADDLNVPPPARRSSPKPAASGSGMDGAYTLQVVSYQSRTEANLFAEELQARGHASFVMRADIEGRGTFYRVRIGPFDSKREAEQYRNEFEGREQMNTFVVKRRD